MNRHYWQLWQRFWAIREAGPFGSAKPYWFSHEKWGARGLLAILLVLALVASGLEVLLSFMNRNLINALEQKNIESSTSALDSQNEEHLDRHLHAMTTTFISVGHRVSLVQHHQYVLALAGDSSWQLMPDQSYTSSASWMN